MRYGVIRAARALPPTEEQRRQIEAAGCEMILEERSQALPAQSILLPLLHRLRSGDEVFAHSLGVIDASTGELARMLYGFNERGVALHIVGGSQVESLTPTAQMPRALALLAEHEANCPVALSARRRVRPAETPLTQYQMRFARQMRRRGHSTRAIGLIFQLSPRQMAAVLREPDEPEEPGESAQLPYIPDAPDPLPKTST